MATLAILSQEGRDLAACIDTAEGVISPEQDETLARLLVDLPAKVDATVAVIQSLERKADHFALLAKRARAGADYLTGKVRAAMEDQQLVKLVGPLGHSLSLPEPNTVEIIEPDLTKWNWAREYTRWIDPETGHSEPDKVKIKQAIKAGTFPEGLARLVRGKMSIK